MGVQEKVLKCLLKTSSIGPGKAQSVGVLSLVARFAKRLEHLRWPDSRESFWGSRTEPLFCESRFGGLKIGESQVCGDPGDRCTRYERRAFSVNQFPQFALRIAGHRS